MPEQSITNPGGVWGAPVQTGKRTMPVINGSSFTLLQNSVVALSSAADQKGYATTTLDDTGVIGVLDADVASGAIGDVAVEGLHLVLVSSSAIPAYKALLGVSTTLTPTSSVSGLVKTSTLVAASSGGSLPMGSIIGICQSSTVDASSVTGDKAYVLAYIHKM